MNKKLLRFLAVGMLFILVLGCFGCSGGGGQQEPAGEEGEEGGEEVALKSEYKLTMNVSTDTCWGQGGVKFAELVNEYTDGKVNVKVYPNAQLVGGDQMRQAEMVQSGAIDFMLNSTINIAPTIPEFDVFSLPFMFPSYEAVDAVVNSEAGQKLLDVLGDYNMVGLGYGENGFRELTNNVRPITSPDDMKGLKIRVVTPIYIDIMRALGANPIAMNWGEVFTSLQQGVIDGQENPVVGIIIPNKVYEVQKYMTNWHYSYDALVLAVNKDVWESIPADLQEQIQRAAKDAMAYQIQISREGLAEGNDFLREQGMEVTDLTPEQLVPFKELTKPVYDDYAEKVGLDIVKAFEEVVAGMQ
ncbi:MAG TPA: DctP family TRAP transporter solute-binding subunit [Firmicutes bacterium]|nr:DctP family TRAP transporter solute-binding subunit [Bacillota bacterium]